MGGDGEGRGRQARLRVRPHPIYFSGAVSFAAFVALVVTLLLRHNELSASTEGRIVGWGVLVAALGFVAPAVRWSRTWVELEQRRLRCSSGFVWRHALDLDLDRARHTSVEQSALGRWLRYGHVRVVDEAGGDHLSPPIGRVDEFRATLPAIRGRARREG